MKKCNICHANKEENEFEENFKSCNKCRTKRYLYYQKNEMKIKKKEYREKNKEKIMLKKKKFYEEKSQDNKWKLIKNIKSKNLEKRKKLNLQFNDIEILGCSVENFILWIEFQFDFYMNWDNYGVYWHIDHVIPRYCINNLEDAKKILNWKNIRPLEKEENREKWNKLLQEEINIHEEIYYDFLFSKE